jgi:DNA-binding MarR family transcriptional regulator
VQSGYLERAEDPNDRRAKVLRLTPSGAKLVDAGIQERYRWMDELAATWMRGTMQRSPMR